MEEKFELLEQVYYDASMASYTIEKLLEELRDKDNRIKSYFEEILKEYHNFEDEAKNLLEKHDLDLDKPGIMAKMGSAMGIKKEVHSDNSDSAMAEMMIQGVTMGSVEMEKKLSAYEKELDKEEEKIARKFLKFQEKTIDHLKKYL